MEQLNRYGLRTAGTIVKVRLYEAGFCIDRNEDGIIQASRDLNEDADIAEAELLPWREAECVPFEVVLMPGYEGKYIPGTYEQSYANDIFSSE